MKKEIYLKFDYSRRCKQILDKVVMVDSPDPVEIERKPSDTLLSVIYQEDGLTHLPTGDIGYYVSDKANPQIKQFILDNLLIDVSSAAAPKIPDGIDDALAFDLMRRDGELPEVYADRLNQFVNDNQELAKKLYDQSLVREDSKPLDSE